jgi:hypothetical protein
MNRYKNPKWWTAENDSTWERTKAAFKRDWDQTMHDIGGNRPDLDQDVDDTLKQAAGKQAIPPRGQPNYDEAEPAYRFGYGARSHYSHEYPAWNDELEGRLKGDWRESYPSRDAYWARDLAAIRYGWDYAERRKTKKAR